MLTLLHALLQDNTLTPVQQQANIAFLFIFYFFMYNCFPLKFEKEKFLMIEIVPLPQTCSPLPPRRALLTIPTTMAPFQVRTSPNIFHSSHGFRQKSNEHFQNIGTASNKRFAKGCYEATSPILTSPWLLLMKEK